MVSPILDRQHRSMPSFATTVQHKEAIQKMAWHFVSNGTPFLSTATAEQRPQLSQVLHHPECANCICARRKPGKERMPYGLDSMDSQLKAWCSNPFE
ncbi:hypothetical protein STEG23_009572 [Scotinomys teguina]